MYSLENKSEESRAFQSNLEKQSPTAQFKDNRAQSPIGTRDNTVQREKKENLTGMPDDLKSGIESLSGFSMDDVRVHYNSSKPATVQALAYTQGTDIHVAPGQEKHLPHEAWHVAQQMAGRVSPTTNINGMPMNDNAELEHEADVMGNRAVQREKNDNLKSVFSPNKSLLRSSSFDVVSQCLTDKQKRSVKKYRLTDNFKNNHMMKVFMISNRNVAKAGLERLGNVTEGRRITDSILVDSGTTVHEIEVAALKSITEDNGGDKAKAYRFVKRGTSQPQIKCKLEGMNIPLETVEARVEKDSRNPGKHKLSAVKRSEQKISSFVIAGPWENDTVEGYHYENVDKWNEVDNDDSLGNCYECIFDALEKIERRGEVALLSSVCAELPEFDASLIANEINVMVKKRKIKTIDLPFGVIYKAIDVR